MKCPKCMTETRIGNSRYVLDNSKLFYEQDFYCRNKKCPNNNQVIETSRSELPVTTSETPLETSFDEE